MKTQAKKFSSRKGLNTRQIFEFLTEPQDWNMIATKCSKNEKHEHFGKDPKEILKIWRTKSSTGANAGMTLDRYIMAKLNGVQLDVSTMSATEQIKCKQFDTMYPTHLESLNLIGQEVWLNSMQGLNFRMDALYHRPNAKKDNSLLIIDWKNTEELQMSNTWRNFLGPLQGLEDCEYNKLSLQLHLYRYVIEELNENYDMNIGHIDGRLFQFSTVQGFKVHKPSFVYDKGLIHSTIEFAYEERKRREELAKTTTDKYAVLDVETNGKTSITEICIKIVQNGEVIDQFTSLVNPQTPIPEFIVNLTGITESMVSTAPTFDKIIDKVEAITEGCTIVAHNAQFDYGMINREYNRLDITFNRKRICTMDYAKTYGTEVPETYSLKNLCKVYGIPLLNHHRAEGDVDATVKLFNILNENKANDDK